MKQVHIVIAGAGIGGLCLAQGLRKRGISFNVYEKDAAADSRRQGYRIRIDQTGQQALAACLTPELYTLFQATCALPVAGVKTLNPSLTPLTDKWIYAWMDGEKVETADLKADRLTLREILSAGISRHIHYDKKIIRYEETADGKVLSFFSDGSTVVSDILVAADGANSALIAQRFPGTAPTDTGSVCLYGKTFLHESVKEQVAAVLQSGTSAIFGTGLAVIIDAMLFEMLPERVIPAGVQLTAHNDYMYWALIGKRESFGLDSAHPLRFLPAGLTVLLHQLTADWAPGLQSLFALTDPGMTTMVPVRTSLVRAQWLSGPVTGLGDALHTMSPAAGLGANTALYDAEILAGRLGDAVAGKITLQAAIAEYEQSMREQSSAAILASRDGGEKLFDQHRYPVEG
jgi:2-polyprenyl-6-methoxyphenol hydroxylase-like FAD-dependent oxidoreductase